MNPVLKKLIVKDVRLSLPLMGLMAAGGLIALGVMLTGQVGYAIGGILYITAQIAGAIFIGMYCIVQERKDQSNLLALSLPVSVQQLNVVKFSAALLMYTAPWLLLTVLSLSLTLLKSSIPDGMVVYSLTLQFAFLAMACTYFAVVSASRSDAVAGFGILVLNMLFSVFMVWTSQPALRAPISTERIVWPPTSVITLGVEALMILGSLLFGFLYLSRRREAF
jgi:hypothetical protein